MKISFNQKQYRGKDRIYIAIPNSPRISRLWIWNEEQAEYTTPERGKAFMARRYEVRSGKRERVSEFFPTLEDARKWQSSPLESDRREVDHVNPSKTLAEVIGDWKLRSFPRLAPTTRIAYEKLIRIYFDGLVNVPIRELSPKMVDHWLDWLTGAESGHGNSRKRKHFKHELTLLGTVLKYYQSYEDDPHFIFPIKGRHRERVRCGNSEHRSKAISEEDFLKFRNALQAEKNGEFFAELATVQFYQAHRISETAALYWEDIQLKSGSPRDSLIVVQRSICWPRMKGIESYVRIGFKNSRSNGGMKVQPLHPAVFEIFKRRSSPEASGLIFRYKGRHLEYRAIQHQYDRALRKAGLPYSSTHFLRHGGTSLVYNASGGDLEAAKQALGNSSLQTTLIYAKRDPRALKKVYDAEWVRLEGAELAASGCN